MAVKSAGDMDPQASQRALIKLKQRNQKNTRILAALRSSAGAREGVPAIPGYLKRSIARANTGEEEVSSKVVDHRRAINRMVAKYL